ncbi:MAG: 30S ribosomal protein S8 [Halothiobacillus sp. 24-54-40]|nr:30S ribosomal protein S8 [Halothiobacillaceae bacterium]OYV46933.1 MAG: 30S ribosomal protein S8 [Halothiobacillus sp. 20-53-49]OYY40333.1 MAG: 30S ribosomal protein S8 [Halothiobacillus sp. 35-54-62]OYY55986.1 MAG: 30S ribosomal protein S8 [Halothiobacillus sp. 28-55-5]OYZ86977.1 MAG: 30S ribosomal protein S8 [Halothiobacillus sp. 24-54-40]OZA80523.1 MAG: 30S ribosomal protein S8 [Halothiobacillus sp. 39-53-45]HQS02879.1 30S ribosomal protein S8 [Halothiobacillus sp.]
MSMNDPISDMLTRIRNAQAARKPQVSMPSSKFKLSIAEVLKAEGFIGEVSTVGDVKPVLTIVLKYFQGKPVIDTIKRVSKPGYRVYKNADELPTVIGGLGVAIVSTSQGVMPDREARRNNIGGEIICLVS